MNEKDQFENADLEFDEEFLDFDDVEPGNPESWSPFVRDDFDGSEPAEPIDGELDWEQLRQVGLRQARKFNLPHGEEEDIVQICLKKLFARIDTVEKPYGFLRKSVSNECMNTLRTHNFAMRSSSPLPYPGSPEWETTRTVDSLNLRYIKPGSPVHELIQQENIMMVLDEISLAHQALFLHYLAGYDSKRLAEMFGYSSDRSVNQTLTRIKRQLREKFQDSELFGV